MLDPDACFPQILLFKLYCSFTERTGNDSDPIQLARSLCLETYAFRTSDLDLVNASPEQLPPFAIIASKDVVTPEDEKWTAADGAQVGQPIRRYRWGTAFPLNRDHSDLIILKQLLFGHRNFAVHDLLQDSWRRAHIFAQEYEALLAEQQQERISARGSLRVCVGSERVQPPAVTWVQNVT